MAIDIRATVTCTLGPLISASISDSYIEGAGIIKTRGTCVINGQIKPSAGDTVVFSYSKIDPQLNTEITRRIPRALRVLSFFVDPLRRTTQVELGCPFTVAENTKDDSTYKPIGAGLEECYDIATVQASALNIFLECQQRLDLSNDGNPDLRNGFSVKEFDLSPGYVQIMSDLLVSENYYAYIEPSGKIKILQIPVGAPLAPQGKVVKEHRVIDISPIGVGTIPPKELRVNYSTLKLKDGNIGNDIKRLSWEEEETIGTPQSIQITYKDGETNDTRTFKYIPRQKTITTYDAWDRKVKSVTTDYSIRAVVASSYVQAQLEYVNNYNGTNGVTLTGSTGSFEEVTISTTEIFYKIPCEVPPPGTCNFGETPAPGYEEVDREVTTVESPKIAIASKVAPSFFNDDNSLINLPGGSTVSAITTITYEQQYRSATVRGPENEDGEFATINLGSYPVTKTKTHYRKAYAETQAGQQDIAMRVNQGQKLPDFLSAALGLVDDGVETRIVTGRESAVQIRPPLAQRIFNYYSDTGAGANPNNGYRVESTGNFQTFLDAGGDGTGRLDISIPYVSDDKFTRVGSTYISTPPAFRPETAVNAFGKVQQKIITGTRYGLNIQLLPEDLPSDPVSGLEVFLGGTTNSYITNGTTYTMDANGIVASTDAIAIGIVGLNYASANASLPAGPSSSIPLAPVTYIGSVASISGDPQTVLDAAFPDAVALDGIKNLATGDYWVYDGTDWVFRGPFPGAVVTNVAPSALLGTIATVGATPQTALNAAYPSATAGDGVQAVDTSDFWVYDGTTWYNRGQNPGFVLEFVGGGLIPLFDLLISTTSTVRSRVEVTKFEYALNLLTSVVTTVRSTSTNLIVTPIRIPAAIAFAIAAAAPRIDTSVDVRVPNTVFTIEAKVPQVGSGIGLVVDPPATTITITAPEPTISTV